MVEEPVSGVARGDPPGNEAEELNVTRPNPFLATITWRINWNQAKAKQKCLQSKYVEVGGKDCRLLVYPSGDTQALPGYVSFYLQLQDPNLISNHRWDCFASYTLAVLNSADRGADLSRESWHRFLSRPSRQQTRPLSSSSHGWADFTSAAQILDPKAGFLVNGCITVSATVLVLEESVQFTRDTDSSAAGEEILSGKFTWRMSNFGLFRDMIRVQKIMSPPFSAGDCSLRISVYQSTVGGKEHLSLCLESKDLEATAAENEKTCWCLFRLGITNSKEGSKPFTRESFGRFSTDLKQTDSASLGWNDFMTMETFTDAAQGYLQGGAAVFQASFQALKEASTVHRACPFRELAFNGRQAPRRIVGPQAKAGSKALSTSAADSHQATFVWRIEHFSRLKDVLKKRKITGLCVKSRRFLVGGYTCRLIIYPRGQSQPPQHLSMFLEVSNGQSSGNWSCFVSHRLAIVNQRDTSRSLVKESQNRYMKSAKDWGWREFITLQALFDADAGYLVNDDCIFAAEVLMLKESSEAHQMLASDVAGIEPSRQLTAPPGGSADRAAAARTGEEVRFTWRLENFVAFRSILETRKVFSRFFAAEGCKLRVGAYTSLNTLCTYLESDVCADGQAERNFWVKSRVAVLNQRHPERTIWKESAICTKTWNSSVLQLIDLNELMDPESGFLGREGLILRVDVLECCPWFEFADLETYTSDQDAGVDASTDAYSDSISAGTSSEGSQVDDEEGSYFWQMLTFGYTVEWEEMTVDDARSATELIADDLATYFDDSLVSIFMDGFQEFLDSPARVKLLLQPLKGQDVSSTQQLCLLDFLSTLKPVRQGIVRTLLSKLAEISNPDSAPAVQPYVTAAESPKPPAAEPSTGETFTEGSTQQSAQRLGRVERRHQQLRAKQRVRPEISSVEAARARSSSCAGAAFIPKGQNHLVKDERRQISEDAACSTAFVGEESPLRPAGARSAGARAAGNALVDHSSGATGNSADMDAEDSSSASIEEITGSAPLMRGTATNWQSPSSKQLRMLARKLSQAEPGLKLSSSTLKQASELISQATAKIEAQMSSGAMDGSVLSGLSQDTDFTALLQDIASGPASLSELSCKPDEAQESSRPSSEGEKDNMADSASEDVAAASVSAERKSFRQRFNPMRGFLSRRTSSGTSSQEPQCAALACSSDIGKFFTAGVAQQAEDTQAAHSNEEGASQSEGPPAASGMRPPPQHSSSSQPELEALSGQGEDMSAPAEDSQDVRRGAAAHDGGAEASGQEGHGSGVSQHEQSAHSVGSAEVLGMGLHWLQSAYKGWTAEIETTVLPVLPAAPEGLHLVQSLLAGLPAHLQAALTLMAPSVVHRRSQGELGLLLLAKLMEGQDESCKLSQPARMAALAALSQIETTDTDACSQIVLGLSRELQNLPAHEATWAAAATLHCMAALPAEPSTLPGPVTRAARAVLHCCCLLQNMSARIAVYEAVRAAAQRHQATAGHLLGSCRAAFGSMPESSLPEGRPLVWRQLQAVVLMEFVQQPQLRSEAAAILMQGIARGQLGDIEVTGAIQECAAGPASCHVLVTKKCPAPDLAPISCAEAPEHGKSEEEQYQDLWSDLVSCNAHTDPQHIVWLGDRMLASPEMAVSQCASSVFSAVVRHFPSKETESRIVASLVDKAMAVCSASASASSAQQGKAQRRKGGAAASPDSPQAAPAASVNLADAASRTLVALMREAEGCGQMALSLIMQKARVPTKELDRLSQQLQRLERELEAAKNAEASARAEASSEAKRRALQTAEAEAAGANARSEHAQAHNLLQASVRKLEGRCEQLEKEVEWVKSERDEAQKVAEASAGRVKELESAASRQKGHRKDDSKKAAKESKAATHRAEVAEAARQKADEELKRLRAEASGTAELAAAQVAASRALATSAESALAAKSAEAGQLAGRVRELEAKLVAAQQQSGQLSAAIEQEQQKIRFFFGQDLDQLGWENLQELEQFHHRSLTRLVPRLVEKRQQALNEAASLQAAAVTAAVAESVVGSPRASGSATPSVPHTPTASTGGATPRDAKASPQPGLHQGSMGSVESAASLDSRPAPKRASSASSTASNWNAHAAGALHGKGLSGTHANPDGLSGLNLMAPPNRAPSPAPSDPLVKLASRPAGNGSNAPGGRLGPLSSPFKIARGGSPPGGLAGAAASVMGPPGRRTPPPPQQSGPRSSSKASRAPGGFLTGSRPQGDVRVRLDAGQSSSAANLQAAFSAAAAPGQVPQGSGIEGVTFPRMFGAAPEQERLRPAQPLGSSGLFGAGHSAFSTTLWPHQMRPPGQSGISSTHQMWG